MGRGANGAVAEAPSSRSQRKTKASLSPAERYQQFQSSHLKVLYLRTDQEVKDAAKYIKSLDPKIISLDFETASKAGRFGSLNGSLRTIQLGFDEPERGIEPLQIVIDCHACDPKPFLPMLRTRNIEKQIHYMKFEQEWSLLHLGVSIGQIYDTWAAARSIQKRLREIQEEEGLKAAQKIKPDWKPRKDSREDSAEDKRLRKVMETEGLKAAQDLVPEWEQHSNTLASLSQRYLGMELPKESQTSDWGQETLNGKQIVYAAMDVAILPPLVKEVKSIAAKLGVDGKVDYQISKLKEEVQTRAEKAKKQRGGDDSKRLSRAMSRATTRHELKKVFETGRQMTILAENSPEMRDLYSELRRELPA